MINVILKLLLTVVLLIVLSLPTLGWQDWRPVQGVPLTFGRRWLG